MSVHLSKEMVELRDRRVAVDALCTETDALELVLLLEEWYRNHQAFKDGKAAQTPATMSMGVLHQRCKAIFDG